MSARTSTTGVRRSATTLTPQDRPTIVIYGAGGFGREVAAAVRAMSTWNFAGFIDDAGHSLKLTRQPIIGDFNAFQSWLERRNVPDKIAVYIAVGSLRAHSILTERILSLGLRMEFPNLIHPDATVDVETTCMGRGNYVGAGARLTADVTLGNFVIVNVNAVLAHDVVVGDRAQVNPGAVINGGVCIGTEVMVGAGAVLLPRIAVGDRAVVGLGAVVGMDVPQGSTILGNPGRIVRTSVT